MKSLVLAIVLGIFSIQPSRAMREYSCEFPLWRPSLGNFDAKDAWILNPSLRKRAFQSEPFRLFTIDRLNLNVSSGEFDDVRFLTAYSSASVADRESMAHVLRGMLYFMRSVQHRTVVRAIDGFFERLPMRFFREISFSWSADYPAYGYGRIQLSHKILTLASPFIGMDWYQELKTDYGAVETTDPLFPDSKFLLLPPLVIQSLPSGMVVRSLKGEYAVLGTVAHERFNGVVMNWGLPQKSSAWNIGTPESFSPMKHYLFISREMDGLDATLEQEQKALSMVALMEPHLFHPMGTLADALSSARRIRDKVEQILQTGRTRADMDYFSWELLGLSKTYDQFTKDPHYYFLPSMTSYLKIYEKLRKKAGSDRDLFSELNGKAGTQIGVDAQGEEILFLSFDRTLNLPNGTILFDDLGTPHVHAQIPFRIDVDSVKHFFRSVHERIFSPPVKSAMGIKPVQALNTLYERVPGRNQYMRHQTEGEGEKIADFILSILSPELYAPTSLMETARQNEILRLRYIDELLLSLSGAQRLSVYEFLKGKNKRFIEDVLYQLGIDEAYRVKYGFLGEMSESFFDHNQSFVELYLELRGLGGLR